jgi:hypothetical protein
MEPAFPLFFVLAHPRPSISKAHRNRSLEHWQLKNHLWFVQDFVNLQLLYCCKDSCGAIAIDQWLRILQQNGLCHLHQEQPFHHLL